MSGPAPTCICGRCPLCRRRESARRAYHRSMGRDASPLNPLHFRPTSVRLPSTDREMGYVAGLLDGEGCITKNNGRWKIQIAMTDEGVIRWLGEMGGTVRERRVKGVRRPCWRWLLMRQADVYALLVALLPLLRVKQDQANVALAEIAAVLPRDLRQMELSV